MLSSHLDYLINDIKDLRYSYNEQSGNWIGESHRGNRVKQITTIIKLSVKQNKVKALIQQWEAPPRARNQDEFVLVDTKKLEFKDPNFAKQLKNMKL